MSLRNSQRRCNGRPRERENDEGSGDWETRAMEMEERELLLEGSGVGEEVSRVRPLWCFVEAAQF